MYTSCDTLKTAAKDCEEKVVAKIDFAANPDGSVTKPPCRVISTGRSQHAFWQSLLCGGVGFQKDPESARKGFSEGLTNRCCARCCARCCVLAGPPRLAMAGHGRPKLANASHGQPKPDKPACFATIQWCLSFESHGFCSIHALRR